MKKLFIIALFCAALLFSASSIYAQAQHRPVNSSDARRLDPQLRDMVHWINTWEVRSSVPNDRDGAEGRHFLYVSGSTVRAYFHAEDEWRYIDFSDEATADYLLRTAFVDSLQNYDGVTTNISSSTIEVDVAVIATKDDIDGVGEIYVADDSLSPPEWGIADSLLFIQNAFGRLKVEKIDVVDPVFSLVLIPDTQLMIQNYPGIVDTMCQWIASEAADSNFVFTCGLGDIVQSALNHSEWLLADSFFQVLDDSALSWAAIEGNHDLSGTYFDDYFGYERFESKSSYGGRYTGAGDRPPERSTYHLFSSGVNDFIVFALNYESDSTYYPAQYAWVDSLMKFYANRRAIVVRHWMLEANNSFIADTTIIDSLKDNPNFDWFFCGHRYAAGDGAAYRTVVADDGDSIRVIMADYQFFPNNGEGWLRILKFDPSVDNVYMTTYSPWLDSTLTTYPDQKTFDYDLDVGFDGVQISYDPDTTKMATIDSVDAMLADSLDNYVWKNGDLGPRQFPRNIVNGLPGTLFADKGMGFAYDRNELAGYADNNGSVAITDGAGWHDSADQENLCDQSGDYLLFTTLTTNDSVVITFTFDDSLPNYGGYAYWQPFVHLRDTTTYTYFDSIEVYLSHDGATWGTATSWTNGDYLNENYGGLWMGEYALSSGMTGDRWKVAKFVFTDPHIGASNYFFVQEIGVRHYNAPPLKAYVTDAALADSSVLIRAALVDSSEAIWQRTEDEFGEQSHNPGGALNSVQYNNAGEFGGFGNWDGSHLTLPSSVGIFSGSTVLSEYNAVTSNTYFSGSARNFTNVLRSVFIGISAGTNFYDLGASVNNLFLGYRAGVDAYRSASNIPSYVVCMGANAGVGAGQNTTGTVGSIDFIGQSAGQYSGQYAANFYRNSFYGFNAAYSFGRYTRGNVYYNTVFGPQAGYSAADVIVSGNIYNNVLVGFSAGANIVGVFNDVIYIGANSGSGSTGYQNVQIGSNSFQGGTGNLNSAFGHDVMYGASGSCNTAGGHSALASASANYAVAFGRYAATKFGGNFNINIGYNCGKLSSPTATGGSNINIGYDTGKAYGAGAGNNMLIGVGLELDNPTGDYQFKLGSGGSGKALITGDFANDSLSVNGILRVRDAIHLNQSATTTIDADASNITFTDPTAGANTLNYLASKMDSAYDHIKWTKGGVSVLHSAATADTFHFNLERGLTYTVPSATTPDYLGIKLDSTAYARFDLGFGIGITPTSTQIINVTRSVNTASVANMHNSSTGNAAWTGYQAQNNNSKYIGLALYGSNHATYPNLTRLYGNTGLNITYSDSVKVGGASGRMVSAPITGEVSFTGVARINWTKIATDSITFVAGDTSGTDTDYTDLVSARDGNVLHVAEVAGTPGLDCIVEFESVSAFEWINIMAWYDGSASHGMSILLYNWNDTAWDVYDCIPHCGTYVSASTVRNLDFFIPIDDDYIGTGGDAGEVRVRFDHTMAGNASHDLYIDVVALYH